MRSTNPSSSPTVKQTGVPFTQEQLAAVEARDQTLLLSANAGSGKTTVFAERFVRLVTDDGVDIDSILAITFTEKAAGGIKRAIRRRLLDLGERTLAHEAETSWISTIHGFCSRILATDPLTVGLDPRFTIADEASRNRLATRAFDKALERFLAEGETERLRLAGAYGIARLKTMTLRAFSDGRRTGSKEPELPSAPHVAPPTGDDDDVDRAARAHYESIRELVAEYATAYQREKDAAGSVDFDDLEVLALELLSGRGSAARRFRGRFKHIMVDEFQDTNELQLEILERLQPQSLFAVGDEFQSIYGFRGTDVDVFRRQRTLAADAGGSLTLRTNFRSRQPLLDVVNAIFEPVWKPNFLPLEAGRTPTPNLEPAVELQIVDRNSFKGRGVTDPQEGRRGVASWRLAEAQAVGERVASLVRSEEFKAGEIAVLLRGMADARVFEQAIRDRGIGTYLATGRGYFSQAEVIDAVMILRAIENPLDEIALISAMVSPACGCSMDALAILGAAKASTKKRFWSLLTEAFSARSNAVAARTDGPNRTLDSDSFPDRDRRRLARFVQIVTELRAVRARCDLGEFIAHALERLDFDLAILQQSDGTRRLANVRKLTRAAGEFQEQSGPDLRGFLDRLVESADTTSNREGEAVLMEEDDSEGELQGSGDAVLLMSIHRAKGLEFPCVVVADLGREPRPPEGDLLIDKSGRAGLAMRRPGEKKSVQALDFEAIFDDRKKADRDEELRVLYVAATRARERLILSGAPSGKESDRTPPMDWLMDRIGINPGAAEDQGDSEITLMWDGRRADVAVRRIGHQSALHGAEIGSASDRRTGVVGQPRRWSGPPEILSAAGADADRRMRAPLDALSYSAIDDFRLCGRRFYAERVLGLPKEDRARPEATSRTKGSGGGSGRAVGEVVHAILERANLDGSGDLPKEDVVAAIEGAGIEPDERVVRAVEGLVSNFRVSGTASRLQGSGAVRREVPFAVEVGGAVVVGRLDALAIDPAGNALIVDYKTDSVDECADRAALAKLTIDRYQTQRLIYALAALELAGAEEAEVVYLFLHKPEAPVTEKFLRRDVPRLRAGIGEPIARMARGEFDSASNPDISTCLGCPAKGSLCNLDKMPS